MDHPVFSYDSFSAGEAVCPPTSGTAPEDSLFHPNPSVYLAESSSLIHNMFVRNIKTDVRNEENDMTIITATQLKNGLGRFLEEAKNGEVLVITKDGKEICEIRPRTESKLAIFDSLTGIASHVDASSIRDERTAKL